MSLHEVVFNVKIEFENIARKYKSSKFKKEHNASVELQKDIMTCRGKLGVCKVDFKNEIRRLSSKIKQGKALGQDTVELEGLLWDAALGYLLVEDATFKLQGVSSASSIYYAYDLLEYTYDTISSRNTKTGLKKVGKLKGLITGASSSQKTSNDIVKAKEAVLEQIFNDLLDKGDIEAALAAERDITVDADIYNTIATQRVAATPSSRDYNDDRQKNLSSLLNSLDSSGAANQENTDMDGLKNHFINNSGNDNISEGE